MVLSPSSKKLGKSKQQNYSSPVTISDALGLELEPAASTSAIPVTYAAVDPMPSVFANGTIPSAQSAGVITAHELQLSASVSTNNSALVPYNNSPSSSNTNALMQANRESMQLEYHSSTQHPDSDPDYDSFFPKADAILITGGTFYKITNNIAANTIEGQMKNPVPPKPSLGPFFTGRRGVLDQLGKIFVRRANSRLMSRRSCLLWGMESIGKTQICLKFVEEMSGSFSHVFWVDASSHESITTSLQGIDTTQFESSGVDGSVRSVLQRISCLQGEWLIVFDNAPSPEAVAKFIPPGDGGNVLFTSQNRSIKRVASNMIAIEITEMEEPDAITLLLKASFLDRNTPGYLQAAEEIVHVLGCIPGAVVEAGTYIESGKCDINKYLEHHSIHHQTLTL